METTNPGTPDSRLLSAEQVAGLREMHHAESRGLYCEVCAQSWPCELHLLADSHDAQLEMIRRLVGDQAATKEAGRGGANPA